jgi:hypothetical protein
MLHFLSIIMQAAAAPKGTAFVPSLFLSFVLVLCYVIIACALNVMIKWNVVNIIIIE